MAIVKVGEKFQVTIPRDVRKHLNLKVGDTVDVNRDGDKIVITLRAIRKPKQDWFWREDVQEEIRKSLEDLKTGRFKNYESVDELIKDLQGKAF